jgi:hypothetical protein
MTLLEGMTGGCPLPLVPCAWTGAGKPLSRHSRPFVPRTVGSPAVILDEKRTVSPLTRKEGFFSKIVSFAENNTPRKEWAVA